MNKLRLAAALMAPALMLGAAAAMPAAGDWVPSFTHPTPRPEMLTIGNGSGKAVLMINTTTGKVSLGAGVKPDEAAAAFWAAVEHLVPQKECPK